MVINAVLWPGSASLAPVVVGRAPPQDTCWATRPSPTRPSADNAAAARSPRQSPNPPTKSAHHTKRGSRSGRPPAFDPERYKQRNTAERCINKLKAFRAVATRYDKCDFMYQATIDIASIRIWLKDPVP